MNSLNAFAPSFMESLLKLLDRKGDSLRSNTLLLKTKKFFSDEKQLKYYNFITFIHQYVYNIFKLDGLTKKSFSKITYNAQTLKSWLYSYKAKSETSKFLHSEAKNYFDELVLTILSDPYEKATENKDITTILRSERVFPLTGLSKTIIVRDKKDSNIKTSHKEVKIKDDSSLKSSILKDTSFIRTADMILCDIEKEFNSKRDYNALATNQEYDESLAKESKKLSSKIKKPSFVKKEIVEEFNFSAIYTYKCNGFIDLNNINKFFFPFSKKEFSISFLDINDNEDSLELSSTILDVISVDKKPDIRSLQDQEKDMYECLKNFIYKYKKLNFFTKLYDLVVSKYNLNLEFKKWKPEWVQMKPEWLDFLGIPPLILYLNLDKKFLSEKREEEDHNDDYDAEDAFESDELRQFDIDLENEFFENISRLEREKK